MNKEDNSAVVTNLSQWVISEVLVEFLCRRTGSWCTALRRNLLRETVQENWTRQLPSQQGNRSGHRRGKPLLDFNGRLPPPPKQWKLLGLLIRWILCQGSYSARFYLAPDLFNTLWSSARLLCGKCSGLDKNEAVWAVWFSTRFHGLWWKSQPFK